MKAMKKILLGAVSLVLVLGTAIFAAAATVSGSLSASTVSQGETVSVTVNLAQTTVSSLGVQVTCDEGLAVESGQWLQSGLMASFDKTKNKGVFSPGGAVEISGNIFRVTLRADAPGKHRVSVKVIGKNGTETVFEETVTKTVTVPCVSHSFGDFEKNADSHWKTCTACGEKQTAVHNWNAGVVTKESTCTQDGTLTSTCADCGQEKEEALPASGHRESEWITDAQPQVGVEGSRHTECTVCQTQIKQESIPALTPPPTEPPATEPEETDPPVTEPEETDPPATEPEITDPPATEPEVTEPEVTDPPATEPEVTAPPATEPEKTDPPATEPEMTDEPTTQPEVTEQPAAEPKPTVPSADEPAEPAPEIPVGWLLIPAAVVIALLLIFKKKK